MSEDLDFSPGTPSNEMAQYLQLYLDETAEQLDALVESLLVLESRPTDAEQLNEAFRLIHSIKGSSAMMGFDGITALTHHLENHFERLRSGLTELDSKAMGLILRSIDFLRECNGRLRSGGDLGFAGALLEELDALSSNSPVVGAASEHTPSVVATASAHAGPATAIHNAPLSGERPATVPSLPPHQPARDFRVMVQFEAGLPLADLKAELVLARLAEIGEIRETQPDRSELGAVAELLWLQILLVADRSPAELRAAADVDGVAWIEVEEGMAVLVTTPRSQSSELAAADEEHAARLPTEQSSSESSSAIERPSADQMLEGQVADNAGPYEAAPLSSATTAATGESRSKVAETVRVEIERLDNLMNLAGELVVNKARFVQITRQMSPAFKKSGLVGRARAFGETMRRAIQLMKAQAAGGDAQTIDWHAQFHELESEIDALEGQAVLWEEGRRGFTQITEAIDQMTRVSDGLQRGVLDTRMVPVAPLFNRFKRVVRDTALELGKKVNLEIRGEKTELDKRMIDELGDPLVHLIRNAIDHGVELSEVRVRRGKPPIGTIWLEASHSGNNVFITVRDDGAGIEVEKVRRRIVERGLAPADVVDGMSEHDVIEHIWSPGFSTADAVSDISGRGVGMDIVKTRIAELNGTVDIGHTAGRGTTFTIRLPLTLAIIRSLLFRLRHGVFAVPIDNVREIVSVPTDQIVTIHAKQTFEVRGEFIPLVDIDDIFQWHSVRYRDYGYREPAEDVKMKRVDVVILHSGDKTMGLKVDELHGGQDIVIKSLAENFIHLRGLSGASILGDGSVCLLLDVGAAIGMAADARRKGQPCSPINNSPR